MSRALQVLTQATRPSTGARSIGQLVITGCLPSSALSQATWISRPTPPAQRIIRSLVSDTVSWIGAGHELNQAFTTHGSVTGINIGAVDDPAAPATGELQLIDSTGAVVSHTAVVGGPIPFDGLSVWMEVAPPAPPGEYTVRLICRSGRLGWRTQSKTTPLPPDDGVSPLPVDGIATRDGAPEPGIRVIGVETSLR